MEILRIKKPCLRFRNRINQQKKMRKLTCLILLSLCFLITSNLLAQSTKEEKKKSSIEVVGQLLGGNAPLDENSRFFFFGSSQEAFINYFGRINPEIQVRYVQEFIPDLSVYGALSYGVNFFESSLIVLPPTSATSSTFFSDSYNDTHSVSYGSTHIGLRYTVHVGQDDSFNFSLGGKGIFYPKQNSSITRTEFSASRGESINYSIEPTIANSSKLVFGPELEANYLLAFKKFPLDMIFGITFDRASTIVSEYNTEVSLTNDTLNFSHDFGGGRAGIFVGLGYDLGQ
jgi:hypothetical protein